MPLTEPRRKARAKYASAAAAASRQPDDPATKEAVATAKRDYYATALHQYIAEIIAAAPPLTPSQVDMLSRLLRSGGGSDAAAT